MIDSTAAENSTIAANRCLFDSFSGGTIILSFASLPGTEPFFDSRIRYVPWDIIPSLQVSLEPIVGRLIGGMSSDVLKMKSAQFVPRYVDSFQNIGAGNFGDDFPKIDIPLGRFQFGEV